jgi:tetratricopeptide (TPR) repeat protein
MFPRLRALPLLVLLATGCKEPEIDPKDRAEGLYLQGNSQYLQGKFDEALLSFGEVRKLSPTDPRLPVAIGEVYLSMGKLPEAATEFEAALKLDAKRATNWSRLGFIHAQLNKREQALVELRKAVELNAKDFNAHEQIGELLLAQKKVQEAVGHFTLAAEAAPDTLKPELYQRAVDALSEAKLHTELLALLQKVVGQGIRTAELLTALGDEQVRGGQFTEAIATYREAAGKAPKDPTLWELVAELHLKQGQRAEALAAYGESLKVQDRGLVHVALARMHLEGKDRPAAEKELTLALESVSGSDVRELTELSALLADLDRKPDALRILKSLAAEPGQVRDVPLQLRTARLAQELKDLETVKEACARVTAASQPLTALPVVAVGNKLKLMPPVPKPAPQPQAQPAAGTVAPKCP